jgi:shikimate dehydrogenase
MTIRAVPARTFVLIGHPVGHSLSPAIHHAAYAELGLAGHRYIAIDCPDEASVREQVERLRRGEIAGANVTVPWKRLALSLADRVDPSARETGAVNVLSAQEGPHDERGDGRSSGRSILARNTDVPALALELSSGAPSPRAAVIIGNGGAALAAVSACKRLGVPSIGVTARRFRGAEPSSWEGAEAFRTLGATPLAWPGGPAEEGPLRRAFSACDLVVQTTSDGMHGASDGTTVRDVVPWDALGPSTFAYDVVYNPAVTPFVAAARARGLRAESGLGMLVGQAALAIEVWLGARPPEGPLRRAAERALEGRTRP